MKKLLGSLTLASLAIIPQAHADVAGFEIGTYQWTPDYKGTIISDTVATQGSTIDVQNDLGFTDESHNVIWAALEHPIPMLPNVKLVSSDLAASANSVMTQEVVFGGETFSVDESVATGLDMSNMEYTFYYEVLDNWLNLDVGLTVRQYDGIVRLETDPAGSNLNEFEDIDFTIPLLYLKGRADLPFTGFFVDGEMNIISYDDDELSDISFGVGYESDFGLGAKAGYRTFTLEVFEDTFTGDMEFDGAYLSVFFHF